MDKIDAAAARLGLVQDILVEINIGEEASKSGVDADSLFPLLELPPPGSTSVCAA